jgi:hypothetical protein
MLRAALALLVLGPQPAMAQQVGVAGRAIRVTARDTTPLAGAMVVLHRISASQQGPLDSMRAGADGRFNFRVAPDSQALILASTRYSGIEYFSRPTRVAPGRGDASLLIVAADTSSTAPISMAARYVVLSRPAQQGVRGVLDLIVMQNRGDATRVAPDSTQPAWTMRLPAGLAGFEVGDGELSPAAVGLSGDTMTVSAPLSPGERQLVVSYTLPSDRRTIDIPFDFAADSVVILAEEDGASVTTPGFTRSSDQSIEGRTYRRFVATGVRPGVVKVRVPVTGAMGKWLAPALATVMALVLLVATLASLRRRR